MSARPDHERSISEWLVAQASDRAPERLLASSRDQIRNTRQRRAWWPAGRIPEINNTVRWIAAAAAVVVVALIGLQLVASPGVGVPSPTIPASAEPTRAPTASPIASPAEVPLGELTPGTYEYSDVEGTGIDVSLTIPASGWINHESLLRPYLTKGSADPPAGAGLTFWSGDMVVFEDPCNWSTAVPELPTGPSVDDLITAIGDQPLRDPTVPLPLLLDGYSGREIEVSVPVDIDFAGCDLNEFRSWFYPGVSSSVRYHQGPGQHDWLLVLDVDGTRVVFDVSFYAGTPAETMAELEAIVDSIRISR